MKLPEVDRALDLVWSGGSQDVKIFFPRRILAPQGFTNPAYYSVCIAAVNTAPAEVKANPNGAGQLLLSQLLLKHQIPTFFIGHDMAQSLLRTKPPLDLSLDDLEWPFPAMLFVLPDSVLERDLRKWTPFIAIGRMSAGPVSINCVAKDGAPAVIAGKMSASRYLAHMPLFHSREVSDGTTDFMSIHPLDKPMEGILSTDWMDVGAEPNEVPVAKEAIAERVFERLNILAVNALIMMTAVRESVEQGGCVRKEREHHGRTKTALWSPSWIGRTYQTAREPLGGTHASPRVHWRRGHWTHQPYGQNRAKRKLVWLRPMLVSKPEGRGQE